MPVTAETVTVETAGGPMAIYDARPESAPTAGVIVIQEAFGLNDHIEDVTRRFADAGYRAVAPNLFHRTTDDAIPYGDLTKIAPHMQALSADALLVDVDALIGYLEQAAGFSAAQVGIVGFCMGGSVTLFAAARRRLGAAVSFYGGGVAEGRFGMPPLVEVAPELATPWLGLYGGQDQGIPLEQADALRAAAKQSSVPTDLVLYPEAGHGFHCDQRPDNYDAQAAADAWAKTLAWYDEHLPRS
jgi:carboxymethylenebutenolidase